jgi:ABC-type amino acid transport substrate-binding protein
MRNRGFVSIVLVLVFAALGAAGCGDDDDGGGGKTGSELDTIKSGTLTIGSDIPYTPFEFGRSPNYTGFDVEVVKEVAKQLELKPSFQKTPFDTIFRNLAQGKFDMVASATTITAERKRTVDFSAPYFRADQSLMVKKGSSVQTVPDLDGKIVGAQLGTTGADYAKDKTKAKTVRTYDLIDDAFKALETGQVAAVINDCPVSKYAEKSKPDLKVVRRIDTGESYGFAFAKDSDALRKEVNSALADVKDNGSYERIYKKWFGSDPCKSILESG